MSFARGIDRAKIEELSRALVLEVTGLPELNVFFARDQANVVAPHRPFVSMFIRSPNTQQRGGEVDYAPLFEEWQFVVTGTDDGTYTLTVSDVDHSLVAAGLDETQIRDGLLAALASSTTSASTADGDVAGRIEATTLKERLLVSASAPAGALAVGKTRGTIAEVTRQQVEFELEIFCWGLYDRDLPKPEDYGEDAAEKIGAAFLSPAENIELRRAGYPPRLVRYRESDRIIDGEVETIGVVTVTMGGLICHVKDLDDTTQAGLDCQLA